MVEQTLVFIKPDGVERGLIGHVIGRFEARGLAVKELKMLSMSPEMSDRHYEEHVEKPFYPSLKTFVTRGPIVAMVIEGENAIRLIRTMVGATNPAEAAPGTLRGDLAIDTGENIVHASDSTESARREVAHFFGS